MALDLNVSPYYDDYNSSKQFDQILFKPGVPFTKASTYRCVLGLVVFMPTTPIDIL